MRSFHIGFVLTVFLGVSPLLSAQSNCDSYRPIVFVHGFLASGDTWSKFVYEFQAAGYCPDRLVTFDWNSVSRTNDVDSILDATIDAVLARTGARQVDLVGHSAGGGVGYIYLTDPKRASKVARFVQIASMNQNQPAGPDGRVPTLNLWSDGDRVMPGKDMPATTNIMLPGLDHYQVATSRISFETVFRFLNDTPPASPVVTAASTVHVGGRAVYFGENKPASGAGIELYYLNPKTGVRTGDAFAVLKADTLGYWSVPEVRVGIPVEIVVQATNATRPVHYFREGFSRSNDVVYLRALPTPGSTVSLMLAALPNSPKQAVVNIFSASQAVIFGRDTLTVDGVPLSTEQYAAPEKTAISFFLYDGNKNSKSELLPIGMFGRFPFLAGVDLFLNPAKRKPLQVRFNGRRMVVRKIPSNEGIQVVVFD